MMMQDSKSAYLLEGKFDMNTKDSDTGIAPAGYHKHYYGDRDWRAYSALLARIVQYSSPGPILDLGAGCGYLVEAANCWGLECTGLEGSEAAIDMAKDRLPTLDIRHHRLSSALPFSSSSFQTVVLNQVIEHLEPEVQRHVLAEALRVLCPGGMLLITSPSCHNKHEWLADPTHISLLAPSTLRIMLGTCGYIGICAFDTPLWWLGQGRLGTGVMNVLFRLLKFDRMSATANAMAFKPE